MKRNKHFEKDKKFRELRRKYDQLWKDSIEVIKIPLEKPQFAGWELSLELTDSGKKRKDAYLLKQILSILNLDRGYFTKKVKVIKEVRKANYSPIYSYKEDWNYMLSVLKVRHIKYNVFHNLPDPLKKYFFPDKHYKYSSYDKPYYRIKNDYFPWSEVKIKIKKVYWNCLNHPNTTAKSEFDKLCNNLFGNNLWNEFYGRRYRDDNSKSLKTSSRLLCQLFKTAANSNVLDDDTEPILTKQSKLYDKKQFGWS